MSPKSLRESKKEQLEELCGSLEAAKDLSPKELAAQIETIGFQCQECKDCCRGIDNSVVVFPFEIRRIMAATGQKWLEAVEPPSEGEWDRNGCFHTLEWRLKKKTGYCQFSRDDGCRIYEARPLLCSTYPFFLDQGILRFSECRGLGRTIKPAEAEKLAERLIERNMTEINEAISLLERYNDFERGPSRERGPCIVHDSEGEHRISEIR
ncbi:Putative zinc- or iron-chelating domain protein [uncultured archaeon]|nr:Putative zinc- or iron-chelating domain protein [uncultured archaeon]